MVAALVRLQMLDISVASHYLFQNRHWKASNVRLRVVWGSFSGVSLLWHASCLVDGTDVGVFLVKWCK